MWTRREWLGWCASATLIAGSAAARAQSTPRSARPRHGAAPLVLAVNNKRTFCQLPLTIAERLGYLADEGLDVQFNEYAEHELAQQAVLSGAAQVMSGAYSSTITLQTRGHAFQSFVLQGRAPQIVFGISSATMRNHLGLADLRGKTVGVAGLATATHRVARLAMARGGLGPGDVSYQPLPSPSSAVAAFRAGQIDAICYTDPVITQLEQDGGLRVLFDTRTVRGNAELFGGPLPTACLNAPAGWIEDHGAECQALTNAMVHALKWLQTAGPSDIIKVVPEAYFQGDRALYLAAFSRAREAWVPDGLMPEAGPATAARMLSQFGLDAQLQRIKLEQTFTNAFALKAKARYRA